MKNRVSLRFEVWTDTGFCLAAFRYREDAETYIDILKKFPITYRNVKLEVIA